MVQLYTNLNTLRTNVLIISVRKFLNDRLGHLLWSVAKPTNGDANEYMELSIKISPTCSIKTLCFLMRGLRVGNNKYLTERCTR